jgi:hypothetical protein
LLIVARKWPLRSRLFALEWFEFGDGHKSGVSMLVPALDGPRQRRKLIGFNGFREIAPIEGARCPQ